MQNSDEEGGSLYIKGFICLITPAPPPLQELVVWLLVAERTVFKIFLLAVESVNGIAPINYYNHMFPLDHYTPLIITYLPISSKNGINGDHSKRSKIDNLDLHRKRSFFDQ